ncbi:head-tail connector protein [Propylenella binzhouense]|uniref:Phage gp6-like head-tail connector protein n=1 Tax=Propylenella binzhouense TaxID=2555902 RepID=A0A964WS40_9HYPH|nr:head-tail connector protein [Propylenella binzhouense]MYZ46461.1 phage gp6-like head-tail connector protein [Propylenella binzhouense]
MISDLAAVKAHLNITDDADDDLITAKIETAESWIALYVGKDLADYDPLPPEIGEAIRQLVAALYEDREGAEPFPKGVHDLLAAHRAWGF